MARSNRSFDRKAPRFKPQPRVLVICEDTKSARNYLEDTAQDFRVFAHVKHCGHTDPPSIVAEALACAQDYEEVHCVIDRDDHPGFAKALLTAKGSEKIRVIASTPCFEYWLLLHFVERRTPYTSVGGRSGADRLLEDLRSQEGMQPYAKGEVQRLYESLKSKMPIARQRAARTWDDAVKTGEYNPSTQLHLLIDRFEQLAEPQPSA